MEANGVAAGAAPIDHIAQRALHLDAIERVITRRLRENKIEGYTLHMAQEIAALFATSSAQQKVRATGTIMTDGELMNIEYAWGHLRGLDQTAFHRAINYITSRYQSEWDHAALSKAGV